MRLAARPLSPHLQIYRWQLTSVMSILHRATGVALGIGSVLLVVWLVAAAMGPEAYRGVQSFLGSGIGVALLLGWTAALFYHLCNGIRHLTWDTGHALDLRSTYVSGWVVVAATAVLTAIAWVAGIWHWVVLR
jgi:succinate dehydrogenase / fumarate reductase, cytochrome b subunit